LIQKKHTKRWLILPFLAIVTFGCVEAATNYPAWIEHVYAQGFYPVVAIILSSISSAFPFSIDDLFYLLLILSLFSVIILLILRKISYKYAGKFILNILASVYILFYILWGFNYLRPGLSERLQLKTASANKQEFITIFQKRIAETNHTYCNFEAFDRNEIDSSVEASYKNLAPILNIKYPMGKRPDKKITFSSFYAKTGISGYFGPFFNEVHVNKKVLPMEYPFVLAHEKAHQLGTTSEAEANFYAWLVCSQSTSQQLQYSANLIILRHFMFQAYKLEEYSQLLEQIEDPVKNDFIIVQKHWQNLRNKKLDATASKINDAYLKTNKVKAGINDYNGVVQHIMNFSLDSTFQNKYNLDSH
jgi:hypothetical protein